MFHEILGKHTPSARAVAVDSAMSSDARFTLHAIAVHHTTTHEQGQKDDQADRSRERQASAQMMTDFSLSASRGMILMRAC